MKFEKIEKPEGKNHPKGNYPDNSEIKVKKNKRWKYVGFIGIGTAVILGPLKWGAVLATWPLIFPNGCKKNLEHKLEDSKEVRSKGVFYTKDFRTPKYMTYHNNYYKDK